MLAPLARGTSRLDGLLDADDVRATARAMRALGGSIPEDWSGTVEVSGPASFRDAAEPIDCGNSGTTARILSGLVVGLGRGAVLDGDGSLRARPMDRVVYPLQALGGRIEYLEERGRLPFRVRPRASGSLRELVHRPKVASAQVKSSLLMAGLASGTRIAVVEPGRSRDHTERLLRAMGAPVTFGPEGDGARAELEAAERDGGEGRHRLEPLEIRVPGDPSSAAFLAAAAVLGDTPVRVEGVGLNPTRTGWLEVLREMGAAVTVEERGRRAGEPVGDLEVRPSGLEGFEVGPRRVPRLLDEIPVLAVLAARARGTSVVEGAEELRVKESDRLASLASNLRTLGVDCREREDGLVVRGGDGPLEGTVRTGGDHRVAMAFGVLRGVEGCAVEVDDPGCVAVSYPGFWDDVERLRGAA
jgi:3-phosphoshikimate 1-carboxyvinyltransferase